MNKNEKDLINTIISIAKEECTGDCFECKYNYTYTYEEEDFGDVRTKGCMFDLVGTNYEYSDLSEEGNSLFEEIKEVCKRYPSDLCGCDECPLYKVTDQGCLCDSVIIKDIRKGDLVLVKEN